MPTLDRQDNVFVLDLGDGENRLHLDWIASVNAALDHVEEADGPRAMVTAATGKFYSNGLTWSGSPLTPTSTRATSSPSRSCLPASCRCR